MAESGVRAVAGRSRRGHVVKHRLVELRPVGVDGSAIVTRALYTGPARITHLAIDYQNQPVTTDLLIKADGTGGATLFTRSNSATDLAVSTLGTPAAVDEGRAVTAATDGVEGGFFVSAGLFFDVAQGDGQTTGDERILIDVWYQESELLEVKLFPLGADAAAVATRLVKLHRAAVVQGIQMDFGAGVPATADVIVKADVLDDLTGGTTVFTSTSSLTDFGPVGLGIPGVDELGAAVAATDAVSGGYPVKRNVFVDVAQADGYTTNEDITVRLWLLA
jgi:hypothetical protein